MAPKKQQQSKNKQKTPLLKVISALFVIILSVVVGLFLFVSDETPERLTSFSLPTDEKLQKVLKHEEMRNRIINKKLSPEEELEKAKGYENNEFNQFISDRLPLSRYFYDTRDVGCLDKRYFPIKKMPSVSVIIIFYNEARSTLLRTVQSVLDRTPPSVLEEIILVDDGSASQHLQTPLDNEIKKFKKTKLIRLKERSGLIRAKVYGAEVAKGEVLMFMDSHCECVDGWAEPLLDRIMRDRRTVAMPVIDAIEGNTWEFRTSILQRGVFSWHLEFYWLDITEAEANARNSPTKPLLTPAMAGGIFAIDKQYFNEIGTYDMGMDTWGGENIEMSMRVWMCGGKLEIIPCSRVGHVFRSKSPYKFKKDPAATIAHNLNRAAAVWMDDYADIYLNFTNNTQYEVGDVSERMTLRESLKCHSFQWYIDNVIPDVFVPLPQNYHIAGHVRNPSTNTCLVKHCRYGETRYLKSIGTILQECDSTDPEAYEQTYWFHTKKPYEGQLRSEEPSGARCLLPAQNEPGSSVMMVHCHDQEATTALLWTHNAAGQLVHLQSGFCLTQQSGDVVVDDCGSNEPSQVWDFAPHFA